MRDAALLWEVKSSFVRYVTGVGGSIEASAPASITDTCFSFPWEAAPSTDTARRVLKFRGTVTFAAHQGLMRLAITDPWIDLDAEHGQLSVAAGTAGGRIALADLDVPAVIGDEDLLRWTSASARLTEDGVAAFDYNYPAGTGLS